MGFDFNSMPDIVDTSIKNGTFSEDDVISYGREKLKTVVRRTCMVIDNKYNHSVIRKVPGPYDLYEMESKWSMDERDGNLRIFCKWGVPLQKELAEFVHSHKDECRLYYNSVIFHGAGVHKFYISNKEHETGQQPFELLKLFRSFVTGRIIMKPQLWETTPMVFSLADCEPTPEKPVLGLFKTLYELKVFLSALYLLGLQLGPHLTLSIDRNFMKRLRISDASGPFFRRTTLPFLHVINYIDNLIKTSPNNGIRL